MIILTPSEVSVVMERRLSSKHSFPACPMWEVACTVFSILNSVMCTMLVDIVVKPSFKDMEGQLNTERN